MKSFFWGIYISLSCALLLADLSISRGVEPNSFFYSNAQYSYIPEIYNAVFYSPDNGETIIRRFFYNAEFGRGVLTDTQAGVLYLYNRQTFEVSYDFGSTWAFVEVPGNSSFYSTGSVPGEIYKWNMGILYRSINYGYDYEAMSEVLCIYCHEVGITPGEVYLLSTDAVYPPTHQYYIGYSNDYGASFTFSTIDSLITGISPSGYYHTLYRGALPGELYLVTRDVPMHFSIYYSSDYGQSFALKYQSDDYDNSNLGYDFTAGREPGSFYIVETTGDYLPDQINAEVTFMHSTDYGQTFTEYYHYLDDTFENPDYVIPYPAQIETEAVQETSTFHLASNTNWSLSCNSDWITSIEPLEGEEDATINVCHLANMSVSERFAEVFLYQENTIVDTIHIIQKAHSPFVYVTPDSICVNYSAGSVSFNINTNINWEISVDQEWITSVNPETGSGNSEITVTYEENTGNIPRMGVITFVGENDESDEFLLVQQASISCENNVSDANFQLMNYPNPFHVNRSVNDRIEIKNCGTVIEFNRTDYLSNPIIEIFNIKGEKVKEYSCTGRSQIIWDGTSFQNEPVAVGIYLYRLSSDNYISKVKKMTIIKCKHELQ